MNKSLFPVATQATNRQSRIEATEQTILLILPTFLPARGERRPYLDRISAVVTEFVLSCEARDNEPTPQEAAVQAIARSILPHTFTIDSPWSFTESAPVQRAWLAAEAFVYAPGFENQDEFTRSMALSFFLSRVLRDPSRTLRVDFLAKQAHEDAAKCIADRRERPAPAAVV